MSIKVTIDDAAIIGKLDKLIDDNTMLQIHNEFAKACDPYVPMETGTLAHTAVEISANGVHYNTPYAHYQYTGIVYGPNIPIIQDGMIVGWFSLPKQKKTPTGEPITYSTEQHPLASAEWDKAMMRDKGDEFKQQVTDILKQKAKTI